jgi:hypothetical protein
MSMSKTVTAKTSPTKFRASGWLRLACGLLDTLLTDVGLPARRVVDGLSQLAS